MIVFLDTNVYVGAKYKFLSGNFDKLGKLINEGVIKLIYTSATLGEVKCHIESDVRETVEEYNRFIRKNLSKLTDVNDLKISQINVEQIINESKNQLDNFLSQNGVLKIELNPLDGEQLMNNYFNKIPPFETKKPYEFKDAIMINAIKHYQKAINEKVFIVSNDKGFCSAFDDDKFTTMNFIGELFRYVNLSKIEDEFDRALESGDFDNILYNYFSGLDIDLDYYIECKVNNVNLYNFDFDLMYLEEQGDKYLAHLDGQFELLADIKYRDEEMSYYDKEEQCYLIEEFVRCREKHVINSNVVVACSLKSNNDNYNIIPEQIQNEDDLSAIDLDEDTFCWSEPIDIERMENEDLICCSECGKPIGRYPVYTDYYGEPLCDDCMVTNSNGEICPICGRKVPLEYMNSGYCNECNSNID